MAAGNNIWGIVFLGGLVLVPGAALSRLAGPGRAGPAGALFLGLLSLSLASFGLALLGLFSLTALAAVLALIAAAALVSAKNRSDPGGSRARPKPGSWLILPVLLLACWLFLRPDGYVTGGWDPGVYVNTGASIARAGGIRYRDDFFASLGKGRADFTAKWQNRFDGFDLTRAADGTTTPHFYHLHSSVMAVFFSLFGPTGPLWVAPLFSLAAVLAMFTLVRGIAGPGPGLLVALLLAVNANQIWFARFPVPENTAQFFVLAGFFFLFRFLEEGGRTTALAAALCFEAAALAKIDALPFILLLLALGAARLWFWRGHDDAPFVIPLLALHALFEPYRLTLGRGYTLRTIGGYGGITMGLWQAAYLALAAAVLAGHLLRRRRGGPPLGRFLPVDGRWRYVAAAAMVLAAAWLCFIRPRFDHGPSVRAVFILGWFLTPLGILLAVWGAALAVARQRGDGGWYLLGGFLPMAFLVLFRWEVFGELLHYWASKRLQVFTLPSFVLMIGLGLRPLWGRAAPRAAACLVAGALAWFSLRPALPWLTKPDYAEYPAFLAGLAAGFGPRDVVLCDRERIATPLHFLHGLETLVARPSPEGMAAAESWAGRWSGEGRRVFMVLSEKLAPPSAAWVKERKEVLETSRLERRRERLPRRMVREEVRWTVYRYRGGGTPS